MSVRHQAGTGLTAPCVGGGGGGGPCGPQWYTGEGDAPPSLGVDGDLYLDTLYGNWVYVKEDGAWVYFYTAYQEVFLGIEVPTDDCDPLYLASPDGLIISYA